MAKIDPAFQAAPNLGASSYNPIDFARRHNLEKFQLQRRQQEQQAKDTAQGLQNLMVDLKGWEDQEGFKELMSDQDKVMNGFLELSRKGYDLVSPRTTEEIMAYKAINDAHQQIKQKADTWASQKAIYDVMGKAIDEDSKLPKEQQKLEHEASIENFRKALKSKSILERGDMLKGLLVTKPQIEDVDKFINEKKSLAPKLDTKSWPSTDENGQPVNIQTEIQDTKKQKEIENYWKDQYKVASPGIKNAVKRVLDENKDSLPVGFTPEDVFLMKSDTHYKNKMIEKAVGSGGGLGINFGGTNAKTTPGELQTNDRVYGSPEHNRNYNHRYEFAANKPSIVPTTGGSQYDDPDATEGDGWSPVTGGSDAEGTLLFYDPVRDELVFRASQDSKNPWIKSNSTFAVPRKNMKGAEELKIKLPDGKMGTLKDILPKEAEAKVGQNTVLRNSGIVWKTKR